MAQWGPIPSCEKPEHSTWEGATKKLRQERDGLKGALKCKTRENAQLRSALLGAYQRINELEDMISDAEGPDFLASLDGILGGPAGKGR